MDYDIIHTILAPTIQATCHLAPEATHFFPPQSFPPNIAAARTRAIPMRPLPASPATPTIDAPRDPSTPPQGYGTKPLYAGTISDALSSDKPPFTHKGIYGIHLLSSPAIIRGHTPLYWGQYRYITHTTRPSTGPPPMHTEIHTRKLGIHGWL